MENYNKLQSLAISDTGFLFDPASGNTFLLNETAVFILKALKDNKDTNYILTALTDEYDVENSQAERDISDTIIQLKELGLSS